MTLRIGNARYGGEWASRADCADSSIPYVLTGEVITPVGESSSESVTDDGRFVVLARSGDRVAARCVHFGVCGGCHYQHAGYEAQLAIKVGLLTEAMRTAGLTGLPEIATVAGEPWGYRNRMRLRVEEVDGVVRVGYSTRAAGVGQRPAMVPIVMCPIAAPLLWRAAEALMRLASEEAEWEPWMRAAVEVELFATGDEARLQMLVYVRKEPREGFAAFCERVREAVPQLVGAGIAVLPAAPGQKGRRGERARIAAAWGAEGMLYDAAGERYWVSRGAFFQVNRFLVDKMVGLVAGERRGALAWDLYAGVGLFSRVLAKRFERVVGVEAGEPAASDLANGLRKMGQRGVTKTALEFLRGAVVERERPDLVVMDPPRAGLGAEVCALLARVGAKAMVYVSCDPVTLSRDLKAMVDSGYSIEAVTLVDMFPQTFHVETVVVLRRTTD